ncbi:MAG: transposase [Gammaproteobacteria bacterium]|jgi:transposase
MRAGTSSVKTRDSKPAASVAALTQQVHSLRSERDALTRQADGSKRQLFDGKFEKRTDVPVGQPYLFAGLVPTENPAESSETITYNRRGTKRLDDGCVNETGLRFDDSVPVKVIELIAPELDGPNADDYEVITHNNTLPSGLTPGDIRSVELRSPGRQTSEHTGIVDRASPQRALGREHGHGVGRCF